MHFEDALQRAQVSAMAFADDRLEHEDEIPSRDEFTQRVWEEYCDVTLSGTFRWVAGNDVDPDDLEHFGGIVDEPDDPKKVVKSRSIDVWVDEIHPLQDFEGEPIDLSEPLSEEEKQALDAWIDNLGQA